MSSPPKQQSDTLSNVVTDSHGTRGDPSSISVSLRRGTRQRGGKIPTSERWVWTREAITRYAQHMDGKRIGGDSEDEGGEEGRVLQIKGPHGGIRELSAHGGVL